MNTPHIRPCFRKRLFKLIAYSSGIALLLALATLQAFPELFAKYDNPARLGAPIQVLVTNGFTIRWVEKAGSSNGIHFSLVFIHGTPGGAGVWASQFNPPLPAPSLIAYDRPGFGGSKPALAQPHLQFQVDALMCLLACATTNRVLLVGHSYGSPIALLAALEHPDKIAGALLIGGDVDPALEKPWMAQYIFGWRAISWLLPRPLRQCNRELLTVRADLAEMQRRLPQLSVPVVMLHGDRDLLVPVENVAWLEQQLSAAGKGNYFSKMILHGVNHFIPWEHPNEVKRALIRLDQMTRLTTSSKPPTGHVLQVSRLPVRMN